MGSRHPDTPIGPTLQEAVRRICWDLTVERRGLGGDCGPDEFRDGFRAGFAAGLVRAREILHRHAPGGEMQAGKH